MIFNKLFYQGSFEPNGMSKREEICQIFAVRPIQKSKQKSAHQLQIFVLK